MRLCLGHQQSIEGIPVQRGQVACLLSMEKGDRQVDEAFFRDDGIEIVRRLQSAERFLDRDLPAGHGTDVRLVFGLSYRCARSVRDGRCRPTTREMCVYRAKGAALAIAFEVRNDVVRRLVEILRHRNQAGKPSRCASNRFRAVEHKVYIGFSCFRNNDPFALVGQLAEL